MSGCENQKVLLEKRWCGRASEHRKLRYCDFMFSSRVYKTSKEACHVLCGLPKLYIYSSMEEKKRRGPHTITKKNPQNTSEMDHGLRLLCSLCDCTDWLGI